MKHTDRLAMIEARLLVLVAEIELQKDVGAAFPSDMQNFDDWITDLKEYVGFAAEYGVAYESIVATCEQFPFRFSHRALVSAIELALLMGYKTDLPEDRCFDIRPDSSQTQ